MALLCWSLEPRGRRSSPSSGRACRRRGGVIVVDNSYLEVSQAGTRWNMEAHLTPPPPPPPLQLTHPGGPRRCTVSMSSPPRLTFVHLCVLCAPSASHHCPVQALLSPPHVPFMVTLPCSRRSVHVTCVCLRLAVTVCVWSPAVRTVQRVLCRFFECCKLLGMEVTVCIFVTNQHPTVIPSTCHPTPQSCPSLTPPCTLTWTP